MLWYAVTTTEDPATVTVSVTLRGERSKEAVSAYLVCWITAVMRALLMVIICFRTNFQEMILHAVQKQFLISLHILPTVVIHYFIFHMALY